MSHSPEPPSQERYRSQQHRISLASLEKAFARWQKEEKQAFELADYLLFPSPEAMEPCLNNFPWFKELVATKKMLFLPTGVPEMKKYSAHDKSRLREQFGVRTPFVISFIGRHLEVKGYGFLLSIGEKILKERDDVTILVGGKMERHSPQPLNNPRWIELGWINPSEVLSISDIFLLPNKENYFDLVLLEALSAGTFVLASNTGGNKTVFQLTKAIELFKNEDDCLKLVHAHLDAPPSFRQAAQLKSRQAYEDSFTLSQFAVGYQKIVSSII